MILKLFFLLALLQALLAVHPNSIIQLDSTNFRLAKEDFQYLLVYFNDQDCQECKSAAELYLTLTAIYQQTASLNTNDINEQDLYKITNQLQFARINLLKNQNLFKQEGVEAVPEFILYLRESKKSYIFPQISLTYENLWMMGTWIKRATEKHFPAFSQFDSLEKSNLPSQKYVIIDCNQQQLMQKIKQSGDFLTNLDVNYVCMKNSNLRNGKILLKEKQYTLYLSQCFEQEQDSRWKQCQDMIKNFRYRGILHWSDDFVDNIYNKNYSLVVAITSNQSVSHQYVRELAQIKRDMQLRQQERKQTLLPIFVVADVHYDVQRTLRLKKFIGGYDLKGWPYPYPLLAFLWLNPKGQITKYIYQQRYNNSIKSSYTISQWLEQAMAHNLRPDYRGLNASKQIQLLENREQRTVYKVFLSQAKQLIQKYKNPTLPQKKPTVILYVLWRSSWMMQQISSRIKRWWGSVQYDALLYNFDLFDNDLPQGVTVDQLPALIVYYSDGSFHVTQAIQNQQQIKNVIAEAFSIGGHP